MIGGWAVYYETEELSYWQNNARTLEETTKIIDSRVWIYLNE